jgi:hypothetical protein
LKLRVKDIEVKVRLLSADGAVQNVRLAASSMDAVWLKPTCYRIQCLAVFGYLHVANRESFDAPIDIGTECMEPPSCDHPLNLRVDDIEVKVRLFSADYAVQSVRLLASSLYGAWLKPTCYLEKPDPVTGVTTELCVLYEV